MRQIAIIGLGYVGLGLGVALSKERTVFGYDILESRLEELTKQIDKNQLFTRQELTSAKLHYTSHIQDIKSADFFIVTVSTPAYFYELPNLEPLINATKALAAILKKGDIVVYESTVYPGATEEICLPLLEEISQLKCGRDFNIGYSPERISPHDPEHHLKNIPKVIAAQNKETLATIKEVYQLCCDEVYPVSNIKTAEAVKILENTQRDVNIAFMNEFSKIMHALNLNVHEIIEAAKTKWSFVPFKPGFVGGHCIAVDPLYLAFKAKRHSVESDLILTARKVNDGLTCFVIQELIKNLIKNQISIDHCSIGVFGVTYKENIPDVRNSLALKFIKELKVAGFNCLVHDPFADKEIMKKKYDIELKDFEEIKAISAAIIVVGHGFYSKIGFKKIAEKMKNNPIIMDIPNLFIKESHEGICYWSL